ncbi:MAG TPA: xanthine dehydrogenase family protein subunit M [Thermoanaerobaculales bacterium]|nr:xanthine dehydrogenase family protein subunit M [Thermoanaerobaculales bacterium]HQN94720.1 xanthine dehydrogenase family protein subunit M [Thermoanaerobaculales bacterium]HQP42881.1 xanthine dehydrogenase family protein subunit M [Thermoanaerobaculales bacterium]
MLPSFTIVRPTSLAEALAQLATGDSRLHGGGTDLLGCLHDGVFATPKVVSLSRIQELRGITRAADGGLRIGALTTISELIASGDVAERYRALHQAAQVVASPQLRNQGTLAGNLCQKPRCWYYRGDFPCLRKGGERCFAYDGENQYHCIFGGDMCFMVHPSDTAPALAALGAVCRVAGPGSTRSVPVEALHVPPSDDPQRETVLDPDEIVTEIVLPPLPAGTRSSYRKVRARASWNFALAGAALVVRFDGAQVAEARVFLSGAAPVPWRSRAVEQAIVGRPLDAGTIAAAADAAVAGAEPLAKNAYKLPMFRGLIIDELEKVAASSA